MRNNLGMGGALPAHLDGRSLELADVVTHLPVNYMRISEGHATHRQSHGDAVADVYPVVPA